MPRGSGESRVPGLGHGPRGVPRAGTSCTSPLPTSWAQGQRPFPSPQCPGALETRPQDTSCPASSPPCLTPADPCVSLRTARHPCPPPDPWALADPALRPGSGSPGSAAPLLRTLHTATTAFTSRPDLCPGLQACHPWEASWGHFSLSSSKAGRLPSEPSPPQAMAASTSSCRQEPWARHPGPVCSQDIPGTVPLLRSWPSVQSPGHRPGPHPAHRLSGRTPRCPRGPWGFAGPSWPEGALPRWVGTSVPAVWGPGDVPSPWPVSAGPGDMSASLPQ